MLPLRVHQEFGAVRRHRSAEMVADAFVPVEVYRKAERGGKINAQGGFVDHGIVLIIHGLPKVIFNLDKPNLDRSPNITFSQ